MCAAAALKKCYSSWRYRIRSRDATMVEFEESVIIHQPVKQVFSFATDINNNAKWQTDIIETVKTSEGPFGLGSSYFCVNMFMGQRFETETIVSEYIPDQKCAYQFKSGSISGENNFVFEPVNDGTKFTTYARVKLGLFSLAGRLFKRKAREQIKKDLNTLKLILENGQ
jgi:uncharacterized membrane protein